MKVSANTALKSYNGKSKNIKNLNSKDRVNFLYVKCNYFDSLEHFREIYTTPDCLFLYDI